MFVLLSLKYAILLFIMFNNHVDSKFLVVLAWLKMNISLSTSDEDADIDESSTFKLLHGHKINWLSGFMDTSTLFLYVCDESSVVTKYSVR